MYVLPQLNNHDTHKRYNYNHITNKNKTHHNKILQAGITANDLSLLHFLINHRWLFEVFLVFTSHIINGRSVIVIRPFTMHLRILEIKFSLCACVCVVCVWLHALLFNPNAHKKHRYGKMHHSSACVNRTSMPFCHKYLYYKTFGKVVLWK